MHEDLMEQVVSEESLERDLGTRAASGATQAGHCGNRQDEHRETRTSLSPSRRGDSGEARVRTLDAEPGQAGRNIQAWRGKRQLGIPAVMDRLVQQALLQVLQPIFEPRFSEPGWGFRPGREAHDAVRSAQWRQRGGMSARARTGWWIWTSPSSSTTLITIF
jgi:hypothetical protein